jgi:hypothetical protein
MIFYNFKIKLSEKVKQMEISWFRRNKRNMQYKGARPKCVLTFFGELIILRLVVVPFSTMFRVIKNTTTHIYNVTY